MGYVTVVPGSAFTWAASQDLLLYAALAIPLVAVTMLVYAALEVLKATRRSKSKRQKSTV